MKSLSIVVLVALVLLGSFAVQSDAGAYKGPNYNYPWRYGGKYNGYKGYPRGYGWNKGWNKGRWGRKYY
uniref:Foot protein 3 variant 2 n=1 Tax=Mytilus californianus TaxID=6549 RepID=Q2VPV6_MYTCA|nr:foot protein 3 variant 2 [Mytilus californianus]